MGLPALIGCPGSRKVPQDSGFGDTDTDTDADVDSDTDADSDSDSDSDSDADSDTDTDATGIDTAAPGFSVIINEILADPHLTEGDANCDGIVDTADDEFVEIVNNGTVAVDLSGATVSDATQLRHVINFATILQPNDAIVIFGGGTPLLDGTSNNGAKWCGDVGATVRVVNATSGGMGFNNTGDTVTLEGPNGTVLDVYTYGAEGGDDQSLVRQPELTDSPMTPHVGAAGTTEPWSPGTLTNGRTFDTPVPMDTAAPDTADTADTGATPALATNLVINEILFDPAPASDANCDGVETVTDDEFVEIVNNSGRAQDLTGAEIYDGFGLRHVFGPGVILQPGDAVVVFGGGTPTFDGTQPMAWCGNLPPTVTTMASSTGQLGFNNTGDEVRLENGAGVVLAQYVYPGVIDDVSLTRSPDLDGGPMVAHDTVPGAFADWSPGRMADGGAFPVPPLDTGADTADTGPDTAEDTGRDTGATGTADTAN